MGAVSSSCKRKKRSKMIRIIRDNSTQTEISTANRHHHYVSPQQQRYSRSTKHIHKHSVFSSPLNKPLRDKNNICYRRPNSHVAQSYNCITTQAPSSIHKPVRSRETISTSTTDLHQVSSESVIDPYHRAESYRTLTRVESSVTIDTNEQWSEQNVNDTSRLRKRSASTPIDMFLIDISNEHVPANQPVSMNIRHLRLDKSENHHTNSSTSVRKEPALTTNRTNENLLNYIPYVCEKYPNSTIDSNQPTRNILHVQVP